jgi:hypothetical protein
MAVIMWKTTQRIFCDRAQGEADLYEERVYPGDLVPDASAQYQVRARRCSLGMQCNLVGFTCRWAGTNPVYDPFHVTKDA